MEDQSIMMVMLPIMILLSLHNQDGYDAETPNIGVYKEGCNEEAYNRQMDDALLNNMLNRIGRKH